jgi:uncharacterized membrane protein
VRYRSLPRELLGRLLLATALLFGAVCLAPELRIERAPLNDIVFHLTASERLEQAYARGEPLLDPWVSEWSLGYPVWRSYQPLPHLAGALWLGATERWVAHDRAFAALVYALIVLFPASVYGGARLFGLSPVASGIASLLVLLPSASGGLDRYGLGYGAQVWRGSGLFTQLVALHFLLWALGAIRRAVDCGRGRAMASLLVAATALSHIVFGYVVVVSAVVVAICGPRGERAVRLGRLGTILAGAGLLLLWFVAPLFLSRAAVNHSRFEDWFKWDSLGAPFLLSEILSGRFFDSARFATLSLLVALGAAAALATVRDAQSRRLLALTAVWLALYFGRTTWGYLLVFVGVPADFHLHRLQAAFELSAILLAARGVERVVGALASRRAALGMLGALSVAAVLAPALRDRAAYLRLNAEWGEKNLASVEREHPDLEAALRDVRAILAERPGRVAAGKAATWGKGFRIGSVPVYAFLTREHLDQASFLYHSMSLGSDLMVLRDEENPAHDRVFGIRAVVAPAGKAMPPHLRLRATHGRFAVYEASPEGYFSLVDVVARYTAPRSTWYEPSAAWLASSLPQAGEVIALGGSGAPLPAIGRWEKLPTPDTEVLGPRGKVLGERKEGEVYRARVSAKRSCHVLVKLSWHPDLSATVDGSPVPIVAVTPGFAAFPVSAGEHEVELRYEPGPLKPLLLLVGAAGFVALFARRRVAAALEGLVTRVFAWLGARLDTPRLRALAAVALLVLVAARPLLRGKLIDGHDAREYSPRLVEMTRILDEGSFPPLWAPDLSAGHGQPLFEFAPPLVYFAALPFYGIGCGLADALQFGLLLLVAVGASAMFWLGRRSITSPAGALAVAAAWLFAPYLSLDLYVRAAFAEASALLVAPLALLLLLRAVDRPSPRRIAAASIAIGLILLAHNGAALLLVPALAFAGVASAIARRSFARTLAACASVLGGLGSSAFFWLPALLEKDLVKTSLLREGFLRWSEHAIGVWQLLWSPWGYGLSVPGTNDGLSFAIGPLQILLGAAGVALALRGGKRGAEAPVPRRAETVAFAALAAAGAWLATGWSSPLWERVTMLQYLAYPWRALMLPALFLPLAAVPALARLSPRWQISVVLALVALNVAHTEPKGYLTFDDEFYAPESIARRGINTTTREEYEPRAVETRPPFTESPLRGLEHPVTIEDAVTRAERQEIRLTAPQATTVETRSFFYPGWTVAIDGREKPVAVVPTRGTMSFEVPAGEHRIVLELRPTKARRAASLVSAVTLAALALMSVFARGLEPPLSEAPRREGSRIPAGGLRD